MRTDLVSIPGDGYVLDGIYHEPETGPIRGGILIMHGNMGNFYQGPSRFLPPALVSAGFACLTYNRRGHDILVNETGRDVSGGAYQTAAEGIEDNERAAEYLAERGHRSPIAIGHSNGGMLAVCFAANRVDVSALVLLSAHAGGADTYARSCASGLMAGERAKEMAATARALVAEGRGDQLMLLPNWWYAISAESLVDRMDDTPGILEQAPSVSCPTLAVRGSLESPVSYPAEEFAERVQGSAHVRIIEGSDHWYIGHEDTVALSVTAWLDVVFSADAEPTMQGEPA